MNPSRNDDDVARRVASCRPLAYKLASKFVDRARGYHDLEDLQGEALLALVLAAQWFDPDRGCSFPTWAWRIVTHRLILLTNRPRSVKAVNLVGPDRGGGDDGDRFRFHLEDWPSREWNNFEDEVGDRLDLAELLAEAEFTPQERTFVRMRFGLGGGRPRLLDEIAARLRVLRQRAQQVGVSALVKLREAVARRSRRSRRSRHAGAVGA